MVYILYVLKIYVKLYRSNTNRDHWKLSISSTPIGAEIFVDSQSTSQNTNAMITGITPGSYIYFKSCWV